MRSTVLWTPPSPTTAGQISIPARSRPRSASLSAGGCDTGSPTDEGSVDLVPGLEGAETDKLAYSTDCDDGIDAALWTINDGGHIPFFSTEFADMTTDWLFGHSR